MNTNQVGETQITNENWHVLHQVVTAFDLAWKKGEQPKLEDFLAQVPQCIRKDVFQSLLRIELSARQARGGALPLEHYTAKFPDYAALVSSLYQQALATPGKEQIGHWYYLRNRRPVGPFSLAQLQMLASCRDLRPKDMVCQGGTTHWIDAASVPNLYAVPGSDKELKPPAPDDSIRDDYVLLEMIGRGGMGEVFKAYRFSLRQEVALKIVRYDRFVKLSPAKQKQVLESFQREMQATANLRHDHIISIYDAGDHNGLPFYTMNIVDMNLAKIVQYGPLPDRKAAEHMEKVARAVDFAHAKGILHRDIKPHNLLLDKGKPLLSDLGLAVTMELLEQEGRQVVGTPGYMAPEQARGEKLDKRTDVYGLGATLYHLLTGRPPHQGPTWSHVQKQLIHVDPLPPRQLNTAIDPALEAITMKCLEKDPEKRYASAALLADDLQRFLENRPVLAKRPTLWERTVKWAKREPIRAGLASGLLLLAFILLLGSMWYNHRLNVALHLAEEQQDIAQQERNRAQANAEQAQANAAEADRRREEIAQEQKKTKDIANILSMRVLNKFKRIDDPNQAFDDLIKQTEQGEQLFKINPLDGIKLDLADTYRTLANLKAQEGALKEAAHYLHRCIQFQEELAEKHTVLKVELALNYLDYGLYQGNMGQRSKELESDEKALEILKEVRAKGYNDPSILAAQGDAHRIVGIDYNNKGEREKGLKHQTEAVRILEQLLEQSDHGSITLHSYKKQLGITYREVGISSLNTNSPTQALVYFEKAKKTLLGQSQYRKDLADVDSGLAQAYVKLKEFDKVLALAEEGHRLISQLLTELPPQSFQANQVQITKCKFLVSQAEVYQQKGELKKAEELLQERFKILQEISTQKGKEYILVDGYNDLAKFYEKTNRVADAKQYYQHAIRTQENWVKKSPQDWTRLRYAGVLWYNFGIFHTNNQELTEALSCFTNAKKHEKQAFQEAKGHEYGQFLYMTFQMLHKLQTRLEKHDDTVKTILERTTLWPDDREKMWDAANDLAKIYQLGKIGTQMPQVLAFFDDALSKKNLDVQRINNEPRFRELRDLPEFQKILNKYEK